MFVSDTGPLKEWGQCAPEPWASEVQRRAARRSHTAHCLTPQLQPPGACILLTANGEPDHVVGSELTQTEAGVSHTAKAQTWDWEKVKKEENDAGVWGQRPQKLKVFSVCHHKKQHSGA